MKITWLGQAGLLLETDEATVMIDPYLSDSVGSIDPKKRRRVPVKESLFSLRPDMLLFTHDHLDHFDPETALAFLAGEQEKTVLCPTSVWKNVRQNGGSNNYVCFDVGTEWSERGLHIAAVRAVHSDPYAIGFVITERATGMCIYITGDTLYSPSLLDSLPSALYAIFLPINGVGNNMNAEDAARLARASGAKFAVPLHVGMLDSLSPTLSAVENAVIPAIYEKVQFPN